MPSTDPVDFEEAYRLYRQRIYRLCMQMVRSSSDAEDLVQEAFLRAFEKRQQFQGRAAFSTWLHRVAVNVVLMWLRKQPRHTISLEEIAGSETDSIRTRNSLIAYGASVSKTMDPILVRRAFGRLPTRWKKAIAGRELGGFRHREIARIMGCSVSASKANVHRARKRLRELLRPNTISHGTRNPAIR